MKGPSAVFVALLCLSCVKQPSPVNAPVVIDIPPQPPLPPPIVVAEEPGKKLPHAAFHYAFRLDRADEWAVQADADWTALLGERPDLVLRNARRGLLISFQPVCEGSGGSEVVARRIVTSDFTLDGTEPEEIGACNYTCGSECSRFGWLSRDANGNVARQGMVYVIRFAHVERCVFAVYAEWGAPLNAWEPISEVENVAWTFTAVPKESATEK